MVFSSWLINGRAVLLEWWWKVPRANASMAKTTVSQKCAIHAKSQLLSMLRTSTSVPNDQLAIQFFPWYVNVCLNRKLQLIDIRPALRSRLLKNHSTYFATSDFALYFQRYFKFKWPFPFEDAYGSCAESGDYCMSRLFEYHHHNLRSWIIEADFVERFSELAEDVIVSRNETNALSKTLDHSSTLSLECSHGPFRNTGSSHETYSDLRLKFMDTELMEDLFLNIPRSEWFWRNEERYIKHIKRQLASLIH